MKILICSEFYKPHVGGVEIHSEILAKHLSKKNSVTVATTNLGNENLKRQNIDGINLIRFKINGSLVKGYKGSIKEYESFLLNSKFDIIFFNAAQQWTLDLALNTLNKINGRKIFFPCGFSRKDNWLFMPYFEFLKNKMNDFDEVICCSKNWHDYIFCKKYFSKKIKIISNGSNYIKPRKYNCKKKVKNFVNISNLFYLKGQDRVISIFKKIKGEANLFMYYSSSNLIFEYYIKTRIFLFNLLNKKKKIKIINEKKRLNYKKVFSNIDAFIFGSRLEYNPLVMFESMSGGIPFVSFNVGIIKEIINEKFLGFVSNDKKQIINYLNNLNYNDKVQFKIHKYFERNYKWDIILKEYDKVFK